MSVWGKCGCHISFLHRYIFLSLRSCTSHPPPLPSLEPSHLYWTGPLRRVRGLYTLYGVRIVDRAVAIGRTTKYSHSGNLSDGTITPKNELFLINSNQYLCVSTTSREN